MTQAAKPPAKPLSPHLQVYRLPLTALMSITHRITGVGLTLGLLLLVAWVFSAAQGPEAYAAFTACVGSWLGYLILFGFSAALFFHLCNGIRHLFWDAGRYFEMAETERANRAILAATVLLTCISWLLALAGKGA